MTIKMQLQLHLTVSLLPYVSTWFGIVSLAILSQLQPSSQGLSSYRLGGKMRDHTKNGRLIPTAKRGKGNKTTVKLTEVQHICPIFRCEKQTFQGG